MQKNNNLLKTKQILGTEI